MRLVVFGNSGSGKTTLARRVAREEGVAHLDLDGLAWDPGPVRRPLNKSAVEIEAFIEAHSAWVVEGCYGDLIELVVPHCTEIVFLNPGVEACIANCRARPWEPEKYASPEAQDEKLGFLLGWVREYETREDEFSLVRHRRIYDRFGGPKREVTRLDEA